jgi:hypothetical protein
MIKMDELPPACQVVLDSPAATAVAGDAKAVDSKTTSAKNE